MKKDRDSYFAQVPLADDDFMPERLNFNAKIPFKEMGAASGILSSTPIKKGIDEDDSRQLMKEILIKKKLMSQVEPNTNKIMLETIEKIWATYSGESEH